MLAPYGNRYLWRNNMRRMIPTILIIIALTTATFGIVFANAAPGTRQGADGTIDYYIDNNMWRNVFWLSSVHRIQKNWRLTDEVPGYAGANNVNIADLNSSYNSANSAMVYNFPYSGYPLTGLTANYEAGVTPCLNLTVNTNYVPGKVIHMEIRFDTNGDGSFETKAQFNTYTTTWDPAAHDNTHNEERFALYSTGYSSGPPGNMNNGRIQLAFWRTDGITDNPNSAEDEDWLTVYCGAFGKYSWAALPYKWADLDPVAIIDPDEDQDTEDWWVEPPEDPLSIHYNGYVANHTITFSAERTTSPIGAELESFDWNFGDPYSNFQNPNTENGMVVEHFYSRPGVYYIQLWATDENMRVGWADHWINISKDPGMPPKIESLSAEPNPALVNMPVSFDIYASDADGDPYDPPDFIWDFDNDGEWDTDVTQSGQTTHTFTEPGTYMVHPMAMDGPMGGNDTLYDNDNFIEVVIKENEGPEANFTVSTEFQSATYPKDDSIMIIVGEELTLDFKDCDDPDDLPGYHTQNADYEIKVGVDFKQGEGFLYRYDEDAYYKYNYTKAGANNRYSIGITVADGKAADGGIERDIGFDIIIDVPPVADAGPDMGSEDFGSEDVTTTDVVLFNASGSYDPNDDWDGDGILELAEKDNCTYQWDFGDNHTSMAVSSPFANHTYTKPGMYTATLTVTDRRGQTDRDETTVWVLQPNNIPVAIFTVDNTTKDTFQDFVFDASASYDLDDEENESTIIKYLWNFGDGMNGTGKIVSHKYRDDGEYTVNLTIVDDRDDHSEPTTITVTALNQKPRAKIRYIYEDGTEQFEWKLEKKGDLQPLSFSSESSDVDGDVVAYLWDFGEGTPKWTNDSEISHEFAAGKHTISLRVRDDDGAESTLWEYNIEIKNPKVVKEPGFELVFALGAIIAGMAIAVVMRKKR